MTNDQAQKIIRELWEDCDFEPGSVGEQLIREGREQNLRRNVLAMHEKGLDVAQIANLLDLTEAEVRSICEG